MPSGVSDTSQTAEHVQMTLLRQAGTARRVDLAVEMTSFALDGAFTALRRRYPQADGWEIRLIFVEQQYGAELAQRVRTALMPQGGEYGLVP
ncbi:MAG: hypothetical protein EOM24_20200 [Chloroflexia bacterium]|nr:hypothetical protein [Chloroflexia bacterium]